METTWLLITLSLLPVKDWSRDVTEEITVAYHQSVNECKKDATEGDQQVEEYLKEKFKALGLDKSTYDDFIKKAGLVEVAFCWNAKQAVVVYPKKLDAPWLAVVARFTPVGSYFDKRSGKSKSLASGIAKVKRFKSIIECRKWLGAASVELARSLKPDEQKALTCLNTGDG
jgi:hypothetical protein